MSRAQDSPAPRAAHPDEAALPALEAFLAAKPVITANDSGGTLEFVEDGVNGFVTAPEPEAIASAINRLAADRALAARLGAAGRRRAQAVTGDGVIEQLLG